MNGKSHAIVELGEGMFFRKPLLGWFDAHARDLPWRKNRDPYCVWISEVMLQQTRVAAVLDHYRKFVRRFPTVQKLAAARESSVLAVWSGLGYYRRARMLHAAAKVVTRNLDGQFPSTAEQLRVLPGIGRYTSAAIASISFDEPVAVVDGNVERVLQRLSGERLSGEKLWEKAEDLLDRERPGDFNQAMMELGATVCIPRAPSCLTCPVVDFCATRGEMAVGPKTARQKKREIHYALDCRNRNVFLVQRLKDATLMASMWELPQMNPAQSRGSLFILRHSITVTDYKVHVWRLAAPTATRGEWVPLERLRSIALTGLARKILRKASLMSAGRV